MFNYCTIMLTPFSVVVLTSVASCCRSNCAQFVCPPDTE